MKNPFEHFTGTVSSYELPCWARFVTQDEDGEIWCYVNKPNTNITTWDANGIYDSIGFHCKNPNWKQAICSIEEIKAWEDFQNSSENIQNAIDTLIAAGYSVTLNKQS